MPHRFLASVFYFSADAASLYLHNLSKEVSNRERQRCLLWKKSRGIATWQSLVPALLGFPLHQTFQVSHPSCGIAPLPLPISSLFPVLSVVSNLKLSETLEFLIIIFVSTLRNDTSSPKLHLGIRQTILAETSQTGKKVSILWETQNRPQLELLVGQSHFW